MYTCNLYILPCLFFISVSFFCSCMTILHVFIFIIFCLLFFLLESPINVAPRGNGFLRILKTFLKEIGELSFLYFYNIENVCHTKFMILIK